MEKYIANVYVRLRMSGHLRGVRFLFIGDDKSLRGAPMTSTLMGVGTRECIGNHESSDSLQGWTCIKVLNINFYSATDWGDSLLATLRFIHWLLNVCYQGDAGPGVIIASNCTGTPTTKAGVGFGGKNI